MAVAGEPKLVDELLDDPCQVVERILELIETGHGAGPISGIVRSNEVEAIRQPGNQVAEHVRGGREAMQ